MNDVMTAVLLRDFLKCLKSTCLNVKPGIAWQKVYSLFELSMSMNPLQPISIVYNFTLKPI